MTEQYKDAYQSKYREETAQIHAPLSLIEKTKAAVREEEKRLAAAVQGSGAGAESVAAPESELSAKTASVGALGRQEKRAAAETGHTNRKKQSWAFSVRKWAYPLTAAAAVLILVSVSLTMRGMKSANRLDTASPVAFDGAAESGAVYENAVESADAGYAEGAAEAPAEYEFAKTPVSETPMMEAEETEEAAAETIMADMAESATPAEDFGETQNAAGALPAGAGQTDGLSRENAAADLAEKNGMEESVGESEREPADKTPQKNASEAQKQEALSGQQRGDADYDDYTIEKVAKRPAGFNDSEVKIRRYEGKTFRVLEMTGRGDDSEKAWTAYVEVSAGEGYVICGEAETEEDFLAAAWKKLEAE